MKCVRCGSEINPADRACMKCGAINYQNPQNEEYIKKYALRAEAVKANPELLVKKGISIGKLIIVIVILVAVVLVILKSLGIF